MQLHSVQLKNTGTFADVTIPVDQNGGLVVIRGQNLDSQEPDNTNGAGKSLLMGAMTTALFERSPVTDLNSKAKDKKDLLQKGSEITLNYTGANGKSYEFTQMPSKYRVIEDGVDLKIVKQDLAKAKLNESALFSEEEFYSTCYIQNTKPSTFQHATDSQRLHFITELFGLQIFDHIRNEINKERGKIKEASIEFDTLNGQLDIAHRKVNDFKGRVVSPEKVKKLKSKLKKLSSSYKKLLKRSQRLEDQIQTFEKIEKYLVKRKSLRAKVKKVDLTRSEIKELLKQIEAYSEYKEELQSYEEKVSKLKARVEKLKAEYSGSSSKLKAKRKKLQNQYNELRENYRSYLESVETDKTLREEKEELEEDLAKCSVKPDAYKGLDIDVDFCKSTIKLYNRLVEHVDHDDSNCPTCGSEVDLKSLERNAKKAQKQLKKFKEAEHAKELSDQLKEVKRSLKKHKVISFDEKLYKALPEKIDEIDEQLEGLVELEVYKAKLDSVSKPEKVSKPKTKYKVSLLESTYVSIKELELVEAKLEGVELEANIEDTRAKHKELRAELKEVSTDVRKTESKLTEAKVVAKEFEMLTRTVKDLEKQMRGSEELISKRKLFEFLFKQYGNTEIKLQAATRILKILENSLNTYSSLVFVEPIQFKIEPSTKGVAVHYKTSKPDWINISRLSGAETNCFRLLFCISLIPLIPAERRPNFIILDEPDAACSDVVRQRLIKDFLPKLRSIVPHVFWVTPKETDSFKEAEVWTVTKENGVSTLSK